MMKNILMSHGSSADALGVPVLCDYSKKPAAWVGYDEAGASAVTHHNGSPKRAVYATITKALVPLHPGDYVYGVTADSVTLARVTGRKTAKGVKVLYACARIDDLGCNVPEGAKMFIRDMAENVEKGRYDKPYIDYSVGPASRLLLQEEQANQ